ncbi:MAG: hypothetical protein Q4E49_03380, partial [Bacteroidales bacterium]|nr:hypothetical protein [Bacteroidales bacterium]
QLSAQLFLLSSRLFQLSAKSALISAKSALLYRSENRPPSCVQLFCTLFLGLSPCSIAQLAEKTKAEASWKPPLYFCTISLLGKKYLHFSYKS